MKAFKHKPEQVVGELFDGTVESAKKILDWFRSHPESGYQYHNMSLSQTRYHLGEDRPVSRDAIPCLELHAEDSHYYLNPGVWLMLTEDNVFKTFRSQYLSDHYDEL